MKKIRFSEKVLNYAKKIKAVNYLGGKCTVCGEENIFKLTFHHKDVNTKEFEYSDKKSLRWSLLKEELSKCDLLCNNCHREIHYNESVLKYGNSRRNNKDIYLEYSGGKCSKCGYNKCPASLTFHHRDPIEKSFSIGSIGINISSIEELNEKIKSELSKCDVLCSNCHIMEHADLDFFNKNRNEILIKSQNIKEIQPKINREDVFKMYDNGIKQIDISKHFQASNGTISDILKKYKLKKSFVSSIPS